MKEKGFRQLRVRGRDRAKTRTNSREDELSDNGASEHVELREERLSGSELSGVDMVDGL